VNCTPQEHVEYEQLKLALDSIKEVTNFVNENKRKAENLEKILSIQGNIHNGNMKVISL
jgi:hypothetical protein